MKIKYFLEIIKAKPDMYGNTYCAFVFSSNETGNSIKGITGSGSGENTRGAMFYLNGGEHVQNYICTITEMKIREFNRHIKGWPHVGSGSEQIARCMAKVNDTTKQNTWVEA